MSNIYCLIFRDEYFDSVEWFVEYPDLPGCIGCGDSPEEALAVGESHKELWVETALKHGVDVPIEYLKGEEK
ncbi:MAG: type II toxin-antitoxin system HicB family antitoxin [Candidatus Babeliales bacterium]|jgi:antitoxin HicB